MEDSCSEDASVGEEELSRKTPFETDPDFCPECGTIFQLSQNLKNLSRCVKCGFVAPFNAHVGREEVVTLEFTALGAYEREKNSLNEKAGQKEVDYGQSDVDRRCSECDHKGMLYTTMQLRSADEGQTVFYRCPECKHRETENS